MTATPSVFAQRIATAQRALKELGLAACLVPSSDPHLSEYLPARWQGREWLSGFTGSMATLVHDHAGCTVRRQPLLDAGRDRTGRQRHRAGQDRHRCRHPPRAVAGAQRGAGQAVGVDGAVLGLAAAQQLRDALDQRWAPR